MALTCPLPSPYPAWVPVPGDGYRASIFYYIKRKSASADSPGTPLFSAMARPLSMPVAKPVHPWPKTVCAVMSVLGLPLTTVGVLPSVSFWLLKGEARLGASSSLRAVSLPLAPKLGVGAHTAVAATRSACSGATLWPVKGPQWCWQIERQRIYIALLPVACVVLAINPSTRQIRQHAYSIFWSQTYRAGYRLANVVPKGVRARSAR